MSNQLDFSSVTISFFIHATEEREKIVRNICEALALEECEFSYDALEGHYGNPIVSARAHILGERADRLARAIVSALNFVSRSALLSSLEKQIDEHGALYLRLSRQTLDGDLSLSDDESIRIKLKPKERPRDRRIIEAYRMMISL